MILTADSRSAGCPACCTAGCLTCDSPLKRLSSGPQTGSRVVLFIANSILICSLLTPNPILAGTASTNTPIRIGLLVPTDPTEARELRQGAELGILHANSSNSLPVQLVIRGRPGQWGTEGDEAAALALDESVVGIITPSDGSAAHQILQVAGRTRIPVVSLCADSSITGVGVLWAVRIVPRIDEQARALFSAIGTGLHWAAVVPTDRAGREATHDLKAAAKAVGCNLLEPIRVSMTSDFRPELQQLLTKSPDAVLLWLQPTRAGEFARALRQAGFSGQIAGPGWLCTDGFLDRAGAAADGVVVPSVTVGPAGADQEFVHEYQSRFGTFPERSAPMAYDAVVLLATTFRQASGALFYRQFPTGARACGATGPISFDSHGNRVLSLQLLVCHTGRFQPLSSSPPEPTGPTNSQAVATPSTGP
jgi:branched-chain amino acid transport system substrate-binding protein